MAGTGAAAGLTVRVMTWAGGAGAAAPDRAGAPAEDGVRSTYTTVGGRTYIPAANPIAARNPAVSIHSRATGRWLAAPAANISRSRFSSGGAGLSSASAAASG